MKKTSTLPKAVNREIRKTNRSTVDKLREWLAKNKRPYSWIAEQIGVSESSVKQWMSPKYKNDIPAKHREKVLDVMVRFTSIEREFDKGQKNKLSQEQRASSTNASQNASFNFTISEALAKLLGDIAASERLSVQSMLDMHLNAWALDTLCKMSNRKNMGTSMPKWRRDFAELSRRVRDDERDLRTQQQVMVELRADLQKRQRQVEEVPDAWAYRSYVKFLQELIKTEEERELHMQKTLLVNRQRLQMLAAEQPELSNLPHDVKRSKKSQKT